MLLSFLGAAHEVTGSCSLLEVGDFSLLVDCGMEQGPDLYDRQVLAVDATKLDAVLLTHAHIDHSGMLPLLWKNGYRGPVYTTGASYDLCRIMLADSAHIQEFEAEWRNRKAKRADEEEYQPIYTQEDVQGLLPQFVDCEYNQDVKLSDSVSVCFSDAGHLLGSSSITVSATENGESRKIVFSGDIGRPNKPILQDPVPLHDADFVVMESTYGDRKQNQHEDYTEELASIIRLTLGRGGNLVIPSFAVGRTQELLYVIRNIKKNKLIDFGFPVYIDSPLAVDATTVFRNNYAFCLDEDMKQLLAQGENPLTFDGLNTSVSTDESKAINADSTPKVIISASGMCEAGRIRHHLKHNLWNSKCTILFVGYQVAGTLGRALLDGAKSVKLFGERIAVEADILKLSGTSSHADCDELLNWAREFTPTPQRFFIVHGDDDACEAFSETLRANGALATPPYRGEVWDLIENKLVREGNCERKQSRPSKQYTQSSPYGKLQTALAQLGEVIKHNEGGANRDLNSFIAEIEKLIVKYDR